MTDTDAAFAARVTATLQAKVAQLPPVTITLDAVSMAPAEPPRRGNRRGPVLVAATVAIILVVVAATITVVARSGSSSDRHSAGRSAPIAARLELDTLPMLTFQSKELTTIAGINQITLVVKGPTEAIEFDDPTLSDFKLSGTQGERSVGTAVLRAGRDYRIYSAIPGHAAAGVDMVIHVLPTGADGNPPLPAAVLDLVSKESQGAGGPVRGTAEYALSTRNTALRALTHDSVPDEQPVYVIVLRGRFVAENASRPPGTPAPRGRVMTLTITRSSPPLVLDFGLAPSAPDLATVGGAIRVRY